MARIGLLAEGEMLLPPPAPGALLALAAAEMGGTVVSGTGGQAQCGLVGGHALAHTGCRSWPDLEGGGPIITVRPTVKAWVQGMALE
jgi:hypothetical protein